MKKKASSELDKENGDDLLVEYEFDYTRSRPNRFASRLSPDQVTVTLDPDVAAVFTTSAAVNKALRALITAMPTMNAPKTSHKRSTNG